MAKEYSGKVLCSFRAVLLLAFSLSPGVATAVMLSFSPLEQSIELGQQTTIDVYARNLAGSQIGAFDFNVEYDSSVLFLDGVVFGAGLGASLGSFQDIQMLYPSQVNVAELAFVFDLSPFQDGFSDFLLFSLTFDALAVGVSSLGFSENILGMAGGFLVDELGLPVGPVDVGSASITVISSPVAVSEPSGLLLLAAGIAGVVVRRNKNPRGKPSRLGSVFVLRKRG